MKRAPLVLVGGLAAAQAVAGQAWDPNLGDREYRNPIIFADYSDPDVLRVGDEYYLTSSSFANFPGLPILHSRDLVNWTLIAHALPRYQDAAFDAPQHGNGVWAPSLRYHDGQFYIYWGDPDRGIYVVRARDPRGPWDAPVLVHRARGWIDPAPLWDEDGSAYLVHAFANSRAGIKSVLHVAPLSADGLRVIGEDRLVFDGHDRHPTIEGPKFYKRGGYYYIFAPAGGVTGGWQTVLRSAHVYGPYEDRIVLAQGSTPINGPHQGGWVNTPRGEDWFIHFQDAGAYGRIVHLQPMRWQDGWPVIGNDVDGDGTGEPVLRHVKPALPHAPTAVPRTNDEFVQPAPGLQWQWQANPRDDWFSLSARPGWLRLPAQPLPSDTANLWSAPSLLLQKLPAPEFVAATLVAFDGLAPGETAGLLVMGLDYAYLAVHRTAAGPELLCMTAHAADQGSRETGTAAPLAPGPVHLRARVANGAQVHFEWSRDGRSFTPIGVPFTARAGRWIGARIGVFAVGPVASPARGHADFDYFRVTL